MKTKKFTKLISVLLVLSMLLTFGTIVASADGGTSTGTSSSSASTAFKLDNGDLSSIENVDNASYSSDTIKYYGAYLGTDGTVEGHTAGEFVEIRNDGTNFSASTWFQGCKFESAFHYLMAVGFTAPKTATYRFEYQYGMAPWAIGNTNEHYDILIGTEFIIAGNKNTTKSSAMHTEMIPREAGNDFAANPPVSTKTFEIRLDAGETLYFAFMNTNNGGYGLFWLKTIEEVVFDYTGVTSWNFGDISSFNGFYTTPLIDYVYCHEQDVDGTAASSVGVKPMVRGANQYGGGYIAGNVAMTDGSSDFNRNTAVGAGGSYCPEYWNAPGIAFNAPYTGTIEFTVQSKLANGTHRVVVGKESQPFTNNNEYGNAVKIYNGTAGTTETWTVSVDVTAGEKVYFLVDLHNAHGSITKMHLKSAEYVYGDLNKNPVTFVAAQETDAYTNGSGEAFDVRFISAVSKNADVTRNIGFNYSVTINGATAADNVSYTMNETYKKLTANTEKGIEEISAPQGTSFMAGVLTLPASGTVVITITSWAETADGTYNDTACQITYENGAFVSMKNLIND